MVCNITGRTWRESVQEQGTEQNMLAHKKLVKMKLEKLQNVELHDLYISRCTVKVVT
jgi:hypothetical protein